VKRWLAVVAYAAVMFYFSSKSGGDLPRWSVMAHDKLLHTLEYAGLGWLLARALGGGRWYWAILGGLAYGIVDEFHQSFVPGRMGNDVGDISADLLGSALGASAFYGFHRLTRRAKTEA